MQAAHVTGLGIALFAHGEPVYVHAYGERDTEQHLAMTADTIMLAASLTKAAFAYLVMQLVDDGLVDLDRPIRDYLGTSVAQVPHYSDLAGDPRADRLTARMLLDHTSGFANWRRYDEGGKLSIHFEPGSRFAYSGEGIALLQRVVEAITHTPLDQLMTTRVFQPLGMTRTAMTWEPRFEADAANGYDSSGQSLGPKRRKRADAAGSMLTTLADYARFMSAVLRGVGLRPATRAQMVSRQIAIESAHQFPTLAPATTTANRAIELGYGLGWGVYKTPRGRAFFKEGHDDGWQHYAVGFDGGSGLLVMTNSDHGESIYKPLLETVLANPYTPIEWEGYTPYDQQPVTP